jgi:hypothetical protein
MLYVVVALAVIFYAALFLAWNTFQPAIDASSQTLASWRDIIFAVPDPTVLLVLKEFIILALVYIAFDFVMSCVKRARKRRDSEKLSWKNYKLPDYSEPL